ncbi:unnamed protein product [Toxocara canis]|uniref:Cytochrome P450 n=1 Tax=Toxocara canis TaxID=6265 RepID=A0A183UYM9_TOXCA|nr:unnamed protein product [Toxocara canis]
MLLPAWLILFGAVIVLICFKRFKAFLTRYMRIRTLVNKMPGPPTVPLLGNAYNLQWDAVAFTFQMEYLFRKYAYKTGGVIRFWVGPVPVVFLCRPKTVKVVLESHTLLWKPPEYTLLEPIWGSGLITSSGPKWHERRRMLTPAFHFTILQSYLNVFNSQAETMLHILEKFADRNETVDLLPYLRRFSMDTISETAMGVSVNAQKGENQDFYVSITKIFELLFKNLRYPWLWFKPIWYALGYGFEFDRHVSIVKKLVTKVIAERTREFESLERKPTFEELSAGGKKKLAFLDLLLSMRKDHKLTDMDIAEEVGTFLVAGYDTVSSSIGFVLFLLGQRQHLQDKVYEELNEIFGDSDRAITVDDLKRMKYLEQCMKESIRMYPTVVMIGRRITEDTVVGDYLIPAGVTVSISPFAVARDPEQWKNPEVYDPDRFSPENSAGRDPFSFLPFSAGPRNCLGQKFAIMEEKVALAFILRRYRVISMLSEEENRALPEVSLKPSRGFPVRLQRRV